jgi:hypothetical protein
MIYNSIIIKYVSNVNGCKFLIRSPFFILFFLHLVCLYYIWTYIYLKMHLLLISHSRSLVHYLGTAINFVHTIISLTSLEMKYAQRTDKHWTLITKERTNSECTYIEGTDIYNIWLFFVQGCTAWERNKWPAGSIRSQNRNPAVRSHSNYP